MQAKRYICVFSSVRTCLFQGHIIKTELLGPFTRDVFVVNGAIAQILERQRVHIMPSCGAIEYVRLHHRVKARAANSTP